MATLDDVVTQPNTVQCRYNAVNDFLTNIHKRHPIDCPLGSGVFWGSSIWLIFCLSFCNYLWNILQILNCIIMALDCIENTGCIITMPALVVADQPDSTLDHVVTQPNTVQCHYNTVNFLTNIHKRHPIDCPLGSGVFWWSSIWLIFCLSFCNYLWNILQILNCIIMALDCTENTGCIITMPALVVAQSNIKLLCSAQHIS